MTLKDMKLRVLSLIEEINPDSEYLTDDIDIQEKINYVIDTKNHELARIKHISAVERMKVTKDKEIDLYDLDNFYKLGSIKGASYDSFNNFITFNEDGEVKIYYYKYPKMIDKDTNDDDYKFEASQDVLEIMPYGIAADLLKSDVSAQYGRIYQDAYNNALNMLDIKVADGQIEFVGGING